MCFINSSSCTVQLAIGDPVKCELHASFSSQWEILVTELSANSLSTLIETIRSCTSGVPQEIFFDGKKRSRNYGKFVEKIGSRSPVLRPLGFYHF